MSGNAAANAGRNQTEAIERQGKKLDDKAKKQVARSPSKATLRASDRPAYAAARLGSTPSSTPPNRDATIWALQAAASTPKSANSNRCPKPDDQSLLSFSVLSVSSVVGPCSSVYPNLPRKLTITHNHKPDAPIPLPPTPSSAFSICILGLIGGRLYDLCVVFPRALERWKRPKQQHPVLQNSRRNRQCRMLYFSRFSSPSSPKTTTGNHAR